MSEIRANTISDVAGTGPVTLTGQYAAKAWVNFNGTGTVAIRASGNVSSLTDNGTGDYTVTFSASMANSSYFVVMDAQSTNLSFPLKNTGVHTLAVGSARANYGSGSSENGLQDLTTCTLATLGDLA